MPRKWFFDPLKPLAYDLILCDLPTRFETFSPFESAKGAQYPTMSDAWIRELPIGDLAKPDCLIWSWSTMPKLQFTIEAMCGWGFRYVTAGAWHKKTPGGKTSVGTGFVLRSSAEVYLIGAKGRPKYRKRPQPGLIETVEDLDFECDDALRTEIPTAIEALRREHSRKPDDQYEILDALMGTDGVRRCELFARQQQPGWEAWGNEVDHFGETA